MNKLPGLAHYLLLANELLEKYGLKQKGWRAEWAERNSINKCGTCNVNRKIIFLNHDYFHLTQDHDVLVNTLLHEVSHSLVWEENGITGHGPIWKARAISIGCDGKRCNADAVMPTKRTRGLSYAVPSFSVE